MTVTRYQPHPYALLLPPLTGEEYAALKADIAEHGVLYPVILDEDGRVLDGVHREKIAAELGAELPTITHAGLSDERKLHLAVGLNMRRRHLDADRRRALVRRLHGEQGLSVRKIASVTGWSKSTIDRDLKTSPFEQVAEHARTLAAELAGTDQEGASSLLGAVAELLTAIFGRADYLRKSGRVPDDDERMMMLLGIVDIDRTLRSLQAMAEGKVPEPRTSWSECWLVADAAKRQRLIGRV
jgi:hypothetical protein